MKKSIFILSFGGFMLSVLYVTAGAQAPAASVNGGVYSAAQATRGEAIYKDNCAACHGDDLAGSGPMPPLKGAEFTANYKTLGDLFDKVHTTMPASNPGSLTEQQTSDVLAYVLKVSNYAPGTADLPATQAALAQIKIEPATAGAAAAPAAGAAVAAVGGAPVGGAAASTKAGVYTTAQAERGAALYKDNCSACHGEDLMGSGPMPPLTGADFLANWKTVGDLFEKTHSSMPASNPGSLTEQQTSDIIAYLLSKSNFPAGAAELSTKQDELTPIKIEK
jgi:mono/diheme cytochrome c family protein